MLLCNHALVAGCGDNSNAKPTAVTLNNVSGATASSLDLSWGRSANRGFASYILYRSTSPGVSQSSALVDTITAKTSTTKTVTSLSASTTYYFKVYVSDIGGQSAASNEMSGTTLSAICHSDSDCGGSTPICNVSSGSCVAPGCATNVDCTSGKICRGGSCIGCATHSDCNDNNACTTDICAAASCSNTAITLCVNGDGCCPAGCNSTNDNDCAP